MLDELTEPGTTTVIDNGETILVQFNETGRAYEIDSKGNIGEPVIICDTHTYSDSDWVISIPATCTETGKKHLNCTTCGIRIKQEEIPAIGHNFSEATCIAVSTCSLCGETRGSLLEHNYVNNKCTMCGDTLPITAETMQSNLASYLGRTVNYGVAYDDKSLLGNTEWEIFYADENNIYIITKGFLENVRLSITGYNGTEDFTAENLQKKYPAVAAGLLEKTYDPKSVGSELKYPSSDPNMRATQYLLDSTNWSTYVNSSLADWAIGGPTLELFVKSYNTYYPDKAVTISTSAGIGYVYNDAFSAEDSVPKGTCLNPYSTEGGTTLRYWLASPCAVANINQVLVLDFSSCLISAHYNNSYNARPVVCLKSSVSLSWNETTSQYDILIGT